MGGTTFIPQEIIERRIFIIRDQKVMLDSDLTHLYGVNTKVLNQAIKRNARKFPGDFMFRLTKKELGMLHALKSTTQDMRSQFVTALKRNVRFLPYVFTEHGALMAANVLNSRRAVRMSVFVVRAFIKMRELFAANGALTKKLAELEKKLTGRLNVHERVIVDILAQIKKLMTIPLQPEPKRHPMGFHLNNEE